MSLGEQLRALLRRLSGADGAQSTPGESEDPRGTTGPWPQPYLGPGPRDRAILAAATRCTACGLCDVAFDAYDLTERATFRGPSELPLTYSRHLGAHGAGRRYLANLRKGNLVSLTQLCPVGVPFSELADAVDRHAEASPLEAPAPETERAPHDPG